MPVAYEGTNFISFSPSAEKFTIVADDYFTFCHQAKYFIVIPMQFESLLKFPYYIFCNLFTRRHGLCIVCDDFFIKSHCLFCAVAPPFRQSDTVYCYKRYTIFRRRLQRFSVINRTILHRTCIRACGRWYQ